ncbi:Muskelin [Manis javanica]|nr:Muskelin [Manis javanica]
MGHTQHQFSVKNFSPRKSRDGFHWEFLLANGKAKQKKRRIKKISSIHWLDDVQKKSWGCHQKNTHGGKKDK